MSDWNGEEGPLSDMLEKGMLPRPSTESDYRAMRKAGVKFSGEGMLVWAELPPGWQIELIDTSTGLLVDDQGRERAMFRYKAEAYEQKAYLRASCRYRTHCSRPENLNWCAWDCGTDTVLFENSAASYNDQRVQAMEWLNENFPDWKDPSAYWGISAERRWWQFWK